MIQKIKEIIGIDGETESWVSILLIILWGLGLYAFQQLFVYTKGEWYDVVVMLLAFVWLAGFFLLDNLKFTINSFIQKETKND